MNEQALPGTNLGSALHIRIGLEPVEVTRSPLAKPADKLGKLILGQYIFVADESADDKHREYVLLGDTTPPNRDPWQ